MGIAILATSEKNSARYVFTGFENTTGWGDGIAWILGMLQTSLSLIGFDAVAHMTEEMPRPSRDAPIAMNAAVIIGGLTGTGFIIVILYAMDNVATILATPTKMPFTELVYQATGSRAAAVIFSLISAICFINGTNGCVTSGSRLLWAMARDNGSPFSNYLSKIDPKLHVPVRAILMAALFNVLFGLLYLGPTVAFNAYIASCTIFLNASYVAPIMIVLVRGRETILKHRPAYSMGYWGGLVANWVSVLFVVFITVVSHPTKPSQLIIWLKSSLNTMCQFFQLPNAIPVNASSMSESSKTPHNLQNTIPFPKLLTTFPPQDYVSAVLGIFMVFMAGLWYLKRNSYEGPVSPTSFPFLPFFPRSRQRKDQADTLFSDETAL